MTLWTADNRKDFLAAVEKARPGDCIRVGSLTDAARSSTFAGRCCAWSAKTGWTGSGKASNAPGKRGNTRAAGPLP